jgi:hypothetical protein
MNDAIQSASPLVRMSTPAPSLSTSPASSSSQARRQTVGRNPTPCTVPVTRISTARRSPGPLTSLIHLDPMPVSSPRVGPQRPACSGVIAGPRIGRTPALHLSAAPTRGRRRSHVARFQHTDVAAELAHSIRQLAREPWAPIGSVSAVRIRGTTSIFINPREISGVGLEITDRDGPASAEHRPRTARRTGSRARGR